MRQPEVRGEISPRIKCSSLRFKCNRLLYLNRGLPGSAVYDLSTDRQRDLESETDGEDYYGILEAKSVRIQNRISPILKALPFQGEAGSEALLRAIQYFKDKDGVMDRSAPTEFLKPIERLRT